MVNRNQIDGYKSEENQHTTETRCLDQGACARFKSAFQKQNGSGEDLKSDEADCRRNSAESSRLRDSDRSPSIVDGGACLRPELFDVVRV